MRGPATGPAGARQGDFLAGKYLLEECLGIGGMGEVYRATNVSLGRQVAIKILSKEHTSNEDDVMRFLREARAAAAVRHPNVVDILDVARDDEGTPFIVQELLSGENLEQHIGASGGQLGAVESLEIMIPVADAVAAAHARDVVHRDLKPANIYLAREGTRVVPKVLDFGACLYQTVGALSTREQRMLIGTPHYMAPEQITTAMDVDARADIWAIGVILYELLVGETPFEAETANAVMKLVRTRDIAPIRARAPLTSRLVEDLVTRCLARDRTARYANASELRDELQRIRTELASGRGGADPAANAVPSLVIRSGGAPLKRRGSALLTLTRPDEMASSDVSAPKAIARPVEPPKAVGDGARPKAARTAADVIREAEALSSPTVPPPPALSRVPSLSSPPPAFSRTPSLSSLPPRSAPLSSPPPPSRLTSLSSLPPPSRSTSLSSLPPSPPSSLDAPPPSHATEQGAPRGLELDDLDEPVLDLDYSDPRSRVAPGSARASLPPVLDPRAASSSQSRSAPPPAPSVPPGTGQAVPSAPEKARPSPLSAPESRGMPGLTPQLHARRSAGSPAEQEAQPHWPAKTKLAFGAAIAAPALAAFVALSFAPFVLAPLGRAMRGDSPLASGVLAVLTLVGAAVLAARALGESRSPGMRVAAGGAVLLGIVMIIVTFSASETAELEIPPAAGGLVPFIAPLVPLGLGLAAFTKAHSLWGSRYDRSEAIKLVALTSLLLLALLELTPLGAVRAATSASASAPSVHAPAPP